MQAGRQVGLARALRVAGRLERFAAQAPLNEPNTATFYSPGPIGYTDYPRLERASKIA